MGNVIYFLQENNLTTNTILKDGDKLNDETNFKRSDLTEEGFLLIQKCLHKWLDDLDKGKKPDNMKRFEKKLKEMRGNNK